MKILAACGNGMGSSLIVRTKIEGVVAKLGLSADVKHCSVGEATSHIHGVDIIVCSHVLAHNFDQYSDKIKVIGLINLLSDAEIEQKLRAAIE